MKIVINGDFGGFGLGVAEEFEELVYSHEDDRANPELVEFVLSHPDECGDLCVATIPDTATDWEINEYDGDESITYVVNGEICHTCGDD